LRSFILFTPSKTSSSQRVFGLPIGLLDTGFHLLIFYTILSSAMRPTWPNQFNLCFLINSIIFCPFNMSFISAHSLQIELFNPQCNTNFNQKVCNTKLQDCLSYLPKQNVPLLKSLGLEMTAMFSKNYAYRHF
jgi:hypothetical protein